jgi:hypothetical protein
MNASHFRREAKQNSLNQYILEKKLPIGLARRMRHFFHRYVLRRSAYDEDGFLTSLTESLRREVVLFLHRDVIDSLPFFRTFVFNSTKLALSNSCFAATRLIEYIDLNLLHEIVTSLTPIYALPGELLAREGDMPREILFVVSGRIQLLRKTQEPLPVRPPRHPTTTLNRRASVLFQRLSSAFERPKKASPLLPQPATPTTPIVPPSITSESPPVVPATMLEQELGLIEPGGYYGDAEVLCKLNAFVSETPKMNSLTFCPHHILYSK